MEENAVLYPIGLVLLAGALLLLVAAVMRRRTEFRPEDFPESLKLFSPTSRTIGGPGNYSGTRKDLTIFRGNGHHVISVTIENMGTSALWVRVHYSQDSHGLNTFQSLVPPGATIAVCGSVFSFGKANQTVTQDSVEVGKKSVPQPVPEESPPDCKYRWRVDVIGRRAFGTDDYEIT